LAFASIFGNTRVSDAAANTVGFDDGPGAAGPRAGEEVVTLLPHPPDSTEIPVTATATKTRRTTTAPFLESSARILAEYSDHGIDAIA
jgi:hypothetical protein